MSSLIILGDTSGSISLVAPITGPDEVIDLTDIVSLSTLSAQTGAELIGSTPTGTVSSTTVQAAIAELDTEKASTSLLASGLSLKTNISDLSSATGSTLVGFKQTGTGSVTRTVGTKLNDNVSAKDFGIVGDGVTDDSVALQNSAVRSNTVLVQNNVYAPNTQIAALADATFRGNGNLLASVYHKAAIPESSTSDTFVSKDIVAAKHLKQLNSIQTPTVVLIGDSITTYYANSIGRSDMLTEVLRTILENQFGTINFYNRGIGGMQFSNLFTTQYQTYIPWYQGFSTTTWLDMVKNLSPDLVVMSFGMNDGANISAVSLKAAIDEMQSWTKVPSIVMATNLVPSPASIDFPDGQTGQESRDKSAGLIRTYAKFRNVGLLDVHRKHCMVRDGYDPVSSILTKGDTISATTVSGKKYCYGSKKVIDFKARLQFNSITLSGGVNYLTVKTGSGANDYLKITRPDSTSLVFAMYAGGIDSLAVLSTTITRTWIEGTVYHFVVERSNDQIVVYNDTDVRQGTYNAPIFTTKLVSLGSEYIPVVQDNAATVLTAVDYSYSEQRVNVPSVINSLLWGNGVVPIDTHGGSGYNHPGGFAASHIYRPLISGVTWTLLDTLYLPSTSQNYLAGNLSIGGAIAGTGTMLDVQSTTAGVRFPNMTTTQKNAITPALGTVIYDTTLNKLCVYVGSWQTITSV